MKKLLGAILRALANLLDPVDVNLNIAPPSDPITSIIAAGVNLAGGAVKLTADELSVINSPTAIAARHNCSLAEAEDAITRNNEQARKTGNSTAVNDDLS